MANDADLGLVQGWESVFITGGLVQGMIIISEIFIDLFTMIIGSIAIGLTVDDNVHFIHGFRREYLKTGSPKKAIEETLLSTGRAMLVTTLVLSAGFLVYSQAALKNLVGFGILTAICISLALVATFLLAPSLMMLSNKEQQPS